MINTDGILERFLNNELEQIFCEKCMNTFLTNIYDLGEYVVLEKYALGLEYFRDVIRSSGIRLVPHLAYLGAVDSMTGELLPDDAVKLFSHDEPHYRLIYVMEKLKHLPAADSQFFTDYVHGIDWMDNHKRQQVFEWVSEKYSLALAEEIRLLCRYQRQHQAYIQWDLHGDNLMQRPSTGEIVILDPYTLNFAG